VTEEERRLKTAQAALEEERCHCGKVPSLTYEPGCTTIHCDRCDLWAVAADFDPEEALKEWKIKVK
jgi:hypothetical protein